VVVGEHLGLHVEADFVKLDLHVLLLLLGLLLLLIFDDLVELIAGILLSQREDVHFSSKNVGRCLGALGLSGFGAAI
jgi:hypothetical protein